MENELENTIPLPEPEKNITPAPQPAGEVKEKTPRGTRNRGNKKNKDSVVDVQTPASVESEGGVGISDSDAQLEDVDSLVRNAENRLASVEKKLSEISRVEPLPEVPPPFEPDLSHVQNNQIQPESENSDIIDEKKRELNPQQEAVVEKIFNNPRFKEKCERVGITALFQEAFEKMYGVYRDDPAQKDAIIASLEEDFNKKFTSSFDGMGHLIVKFIFNLFLGEYDNEYQKKYPDSDFSSEPKAVELVPESVSVPDVITPVGEISTEASSEIVSSASTVTSPRDVKVSFDSKGDPLSVTVQVPRRDFVSTPVTPAENFHPISETPVVLENSAGAPLVERSDATSDTSIVLENKASGEVPQSSPEAKPEVAPKSRVQIAQKEIEDTLEFGDVRSAFVDADAWLGKNGFTSRDIATIEKNYKKASTDYASSVTKTSGGSGVRVNLLKPAPQLSDIINDYVASLSTSGAAFVDIRHAKKFFASDDQKNALAQGLKKYFETRKEYEDGKKDVARGMWEKMGGIKLQEDLILKRDGIADDGERVKAALNEIKAISELRSSIFEEAIVGEMERLNKEKILVAGPAEKGTLQKALDVVRAINPKLRLAFTTAVATGVVAVGVSTAGLGTLGVLGAYAGSRFVRGLIASGVGVSASQFTNASLGKISESIHNRKLSKFQERLFSVEGEADFDQFIDTYTRERSDIFKDYLLAKKIVLTATVVTGIAAGAIANAEFSQFTDTVGLHANPLRPSSVGMAPLDKDGNAIPLEKTGSPTPAQLQESSSGFGDVRLSESNTSVSQKPFGPNYAGPVHGPDYNGIETSEIVDTGQSAPKVVEHKFFGPTVSLELEKIAGGAKSLQEMFKGEGVKLNLDELKNAAVVGKGGSAWGVVHKQLELLAKSGVDPKKLGLGISVDDMGDHAKFSHALEMRTRSILEENGFISNTGEVRIASPDTRLDLTATVDGKGDTHFVINKPVVTDRPVFYEYHPTQRLSVPVNHVPPEVPSKHIPESRINIDTVPHMDDAFPRSSDVSGEQIAPSDQKIVLNKELPHLPIKQSDIDAVANSHDVVPEPRPAGLEKTLPTVDRLVSETVLRDFLPKEVLSSVTPNEILKIQNFLEQMGFSDAYIENRWQDLSRISVGEFQKHIDEILKHKADATLLSQPIHPVHFNKDLVPTILSRNPGADIPAEDRLYKIADLINEKKALIADDIGEQRKSVAQFIVDEALYSAPKK